MERSNKQHHQHIDESEVFKRKSLMSIKNRKKISNLLFKVLCVIAVLVVAACVLSYFFNFS